MGLQTYLHLTIVLLHTGCLTAIWGSDHCGGLGQSGPSDTLQGGFKALIFSGTNGCTPFSCPLGGGGGGQLQ